MRENRSRSTLAPKRAIGVRSIKVTMALTPQCNGWTIGARKSAMLVVYAAVGHGWRKITLSAHAQTVPSLQLFRHLPCGTRSLPTRVVTATNLRGAALRFNAGQYTIAAFLYTFSQTKRRPASASRFRGCSSPKESRRGNSVAYLCGCHVVRGSASPLNSRPRRGNPARPRRRNRPSRQVWDSPNHEPHLKEPKQRTPARKNP